MSDSHGIIWWNELATRDVEAAKKYFGDICGWSFSDMSKGEDTYTICSIGGKPVAGILDISGMSHLDEAPPHWFTYIAVDDVDKTLAQTKDAGGSVLRDAFDVEGVGRIAIVQDPTGAAVGVMTPAQGN